MYEDLSNDLLLPTRRRFASGLLAAGALMGAACGGGDNDDTSPGASGAPSLPADDEPVLFLAAFPDGLRTPPLLATGNSQRAIFAFVRGGIYLNDEDTTSQIDIELTHPEGSLVEQLSATRYSTGIPRPYFALDFEPSIAGLYTASTTAFEGDFMTAEFAVAETSSVVQVGEQLPAVPTATDGDTRGIQRLCTRVDGQCPFHSTSLDEVLGAKPVALLIATPEFCQTAICGPVVELLIEAASSYGDIEFIHAEVYVDPSRIGEPDVEFADIVEAMGLTFEPTLAVCDSAGQLVRRLDLTFDSVELEAALKMATA